MTNTDKPIMPAPVAHADKWSKREALSHIGFKDITEEQALHILRAVSEGESLTEACAKRGTNLQSLKMYQISDNLFADQLRMAKKIRADKLGEKVYEEIQYHFQKMEGMDAKDRLAHFNQMFKYVNRFLSTHDEEHDIKKQHILLQEKERRKAIEAKKAEEKLSDHGSRPLVVKDIFKDIGKDFDLNAHRVDGTGKEKKDQYVTIGE